MQTGKSGALAPRQRVNEIEGTIPRLFRWLLPLSFLLQVVSIGMLHQYRVRPGNDHFEFGWEMGRVARSIALGHGFSCPYKGNTGPTAWEPPPQAQLSKSRGLVGTTSVDLETAKIRLPAD